MASISSIGIGSGVLTSELIEKLASAEREPTEKRLDAREEAVKAKLSDFARIQGAVTDLRLTSRTLGNSASLAAKTATSSNAGISVTASTSAAISQYSMQVTSLAQTHSIASGVFADKDTTTVGTGKLTISSGSVTKTIEITNANNTLQGLAKEINGAKIGVSASVINTGSGYQLVFSSEQTGAANAIKISALDNDGNHIDNSGLSQLAFNENASNLTEKLAAKDAQFSINGIDITRASNTVSDVVEGLTFTLNAETTSPSTIKVASDADGAAGRVKEFVEKFNDLQKIINEVTAIVPGGESGSLASNSAVRSIYNQTRNILGTMVSGLENAGVRSLSEVGISSDPKTGIISFDETKFKETLAKHEQDVVAVFADQGRTSDSQIEFVRSGLNTKVGSYDIEITQMATQGQFAAATGLTGSTAIDADNSTFKIKVDGVESAAISLTENAVGYTDAELVSELQSKINGDANLKAAGVAVTVGQDVDGKLTFTSTKYGSSSNVSFTQVGANTLATLGIDAIAGTAGVDVAGTIGGKPATGSGQMLTAALGSDAEGIQVSVTGGTTGPRGKVTYIEGVADQLIKTINDFLSVEGSITTTNESFGKELERIGQERVKLDERIGSLTSRLAKQFTAADILVATLKSTETFVKNQLAALSGGNSDD